MTKLKFVLKDDTGRKEKYECALEGDHIRYHVEAFRYFLLAIGFHPDLVKEYFNED